MSTYPEHNVIRDLNFMDVSQLNLMLIPLKEDPWSHIVFN
jgi:hypothetical protein